MHCSRALRTLLRQLKLFIARLKIYREMCRNKRDTKRKEKKKTEEQFDSLFLSERNASEGVKKKMLTHHDVARAKRVVYAVARKFLSFAIAIRECSNR